MKKLLTFTLTVAILILAEWILPVAGQDHVTKVGTTSAKFLTIPVGARATAMGGAFVALSNDASATYWNPGALSRMTKNELYFMHSDYFADLSLEYITMVFSWENFGAVGVSVTSLNMDEMLVTTVDDPEGSSGATFDAGSFAIGISYSRNLTDRFSIGGTFKYISEAIANSRASGIAVDVGTMFTTPFRDIRLGVSVSNFGQKLQITGEDLLVQKDIAPLQNGNNETVNANLATDHFDLPLNLRIGLAYDVFKATNNRLTVAVDGLHPNDNTESINAGAEYALFNERFFLRGGYRNLLLEDSENSYTAGFGLRYASERITLRLDYAYADLKHLQGIHQFGFALAF
ncbi:MAG: PorV/PorQ family protein [candidate division KSB1 bacterium]|nr:PorV/PorQ family protein [candidate division KSB1 bacterium]MDZ7301048.1 PorV/PorQ family protein [candidate division KSB1 bacterium]MDZ7312127.1 PorV/PorQ family protein [candidate division KSB1 bacterium]